MEQGLVHIYCGDGKGKTTAAMGLCCRAAGAGLRVIICQLMKPNTASERRILEALPNVTFLDGLTQEKFSFALSEEERVQRRLFYRAQLDRAALMAQQEQADVVLLDEVLYAVRAGLLEEDAVLAFLAHKPVGTEVILTGRDPGERLLERADYVSQVQRIKHPYERGISARRGIES